MNDSKRPIELKSRPAAGGEEQEISIFTSYSFDRNILVPASAFRFTAEGVDQDQRLAIRSGDLATLYTRNADGKIFKLSTGFIDETDTHITPTSVAYVLSGRDTISQLVDNAAVDAGNKIIHGGTGKYSIDQIASLVVQNTRMNKTIISQNVPAAAMLLQTNPGETKIAVLQRYLEITNCLAWASSDGRMIVGKPNMSQQPMGSLRLYKDDSRRNDNNLLEARVKRGPNLAIRQIAVQLQDLAITDPSSVTMINFDKDMRRLTPFSVGRSVYQTFSLGNGTEAYDKLSGIGQGSGVVNMGQAMALRQMALDNVKVLDVEGVVKGHFNEDDNPYDIDQVYEVAIEDEQVFEPMYVYSVRHDYTKDRGQITSLRLCRLGALVWGTPSR